MRAVIYDGTDAHYTEDAPQPVADLSAGQSLIRIELATICSTDREILRGYRPDFTGVMGHEFVGIIEQSSDAALVGARVVGEINLNCGDCLYCRTGRPHHCETRRVLGIEGHDGTFADYLQHETRLLHRVPAGLAPEVAVFTEPLAAALRIVEQVHFDPDAPVALIGDGRLALMIGQVVALTGAPLTVIGRSAEKLELFRDFSVAQLLEPSGSYEVVIDATGTPESLPTALALTRSEGTLVIKSTYAGDARINMSEVVVREITIRGSRCGPFAPALRLLERGLVSLPPVERHAPADFRAAISSRAFKAALDFRE
ncbi:MAG: alcohol dehydrogenase catalytic domain-containing protein [Coriobacteriia bacterium]|nr:alcohol dehydrogenase catalytic domain-containing protein [Coriobacteriia bacterium]